MAVGDNSGGKCGIVFGRVHVHGLAVVVFSFLGEEVVAVIGDGGSSFGVGGFTAFHLGGLIVYVFSGCVCDNGV